MSWTSPWSIKGSYGLISYVIPFCQGIDCASSGEATLKDMVIFTVTNQINSWTDWNSWTDMDQGQKSLYMKTICAKYGINPFNVAGPVQQTWKDVQYCSRFCCKINVKNYWNTNHGKMNGHDIPFMLVIICAKYEKNPSRNGYCTEQT